MLARTLPWLLAVGLAGGLAIPTADAARRGLRVDNGGWDERSDFGTANCPGTVTGDADAFIEWNGFVFSGGVYIDPFDPTPPYPDASDCEPTVPGQFNQTSFGAVNEADAEDTLAMLIGSNEDDAVTARRYTAFRGWFSAFQWIFYYFPREVTVVGFYGLNNLEYLGGELDPQKTLILAPSNDALWRGEPDYDGAYFCFEGDGYIGQWSGDLADGSACAAALDFRTTLFTDGFEPIFD